MQASDSLTQTFSTPSAASNRSQPSMPTLLQWMSRITIILEAGLLIVGIFGIQQVLVQLYNSCWQISFLFTLIGLMIVLMLGQYHLNKTQSKFVRHWATVSNIIVTILGVSVIACILTTPITL